jgi:hypothetical protein
VRGGWVGHSGEYGDGSSVESNGAGSRLATTMPTRNEVIEGNGMRGRVVKEGEGGKVKWVVEDKRRGWPNIYTQPGIQGCSSPRWLRGP